VLHRLFDPGSDRAAEVWHQNYAIQGTESLELQHFYRTMGWLGEPLPLDRQAGATPGHTHLNRDSKDLEQVFVLHTGFEPFVVDTGFGVFVLFQ
jgi:hypothetical protein